MAAPSLPLVTSLRGGRQAELARATPADAAAVLAHCQQVAEETEILTYGAGQLGRTLEQQAELLRDWQDPERGLALKASVEGELAGLAVIQRFAQPRVHHVGELSLTLLVKFWNIGLGRAICEAAIMEAGERGLTRVELRTRQDNTIGIALYEDLGFRVEGRLRGAFKLGEVEHDEVLMAVRLRGGSVPPPSRTQSGTSSM
jgi:RimJ/RimL family protein N-acetyltransferase